MADEALVKKLLLKPGSRVIITHAPAGIREQLLPLPSGSVELDPPALSADWLITFVTTTTELETEFPQAVATVKTDGVLWVAYPKKSSGIPSDLSRDDVWSAVLTSGFRPVTQVALDSTWSALRFRRADLVKSTSSRFSPPAA
jgi:hypothetical protein